MRARSYAGLISVTVLLGGASWSCSSAEAPPPPGSGGSPVDRGPDGPGSDGPGPGSGPDGSNTSGPGGGPSSPTGSSGPSPSSSGPFVGEEDGVIIDAPAVVPAGCGDGVLTDDEACDDGNRADGDGCASDCLNVLPGFSCVIPGELCRPIARCGDGVVAPSEQCDDGNLEDGDGCSARCRYELGKKCENEPGQPSVCTDTVCGDGIVEGAESCDDGNTNPFDGCSSLCLREPDCSGSSCTSECGDGLVINEDCDDGNTIDGDGCSSDCTIEQGFTCTRESVCETINGECVVRVPTVFRDFTTHDDFVPAGTIMRARLLRGLVQSDLDGEGRPVLAPNGGYQQAYITSPNSFAQWYRDGSHATTLVSELVLFDNGRGGYVNRFDNLGNYFTSTGGPNEEHYPGGASLADCERSCRTYVMNENYNAGCNNYCNPVAGAAQRATDELRQANERLTQAIDQYGPLPDEDDVDAVVPPQIVAAQEDVAEAEAALMAARAAAETCADDCEMGIAAGTAECASTCLPCSDAPAQFCTGGEIVNWEGNPLFFPVDSLSSNLPACTMSGQANCARVPAQYGYDGWPFEYTLFPGARAHNFHFTSEVQYWFQYEAGMNATLDFTGDDDVWVFLNGKLAVDIGGVHVPINGSVTINANARTVTSEVVEPGDTIDAAPLQVYRSNSTAADFGLVEGNVYKITIFHAERQPEGSSFKLTLSGFEATPSDCSAECGDGILSFGEECDDGVEKNVGGYGGCNPDCTLGEFCGDGIRNGTEDCDNGPGGGPGCPSCRILIVR